MSRLAAAAKKFPGGVFARGLALSMLPGGKAILAYEAEVEKARMNLMAMAPPGDQQERAYLEALVKRIQDTSVPKVNQWAKQLTELQALRLVGDLYAAGYLPADALDRREKGLAWSRILAYSNNMYHVNELSRLLLGWEAS